MAIVNVEAQTTDNIDGADDDISKGDNNSGKQENLAHSPNSEYRESMNKTHSRLILFIQKTGIVCWMIRLGIF